MSRTVLVLLSIVSLCLACPIGAGAHRLDEYLQATRLSVDRDRVGIELDLTPGVIVASRILASIDSDHDGRISATEGDDYARAVFSSLALIVDGRPAVVKLEDGHFPESQDMAEGVGMIRLRGSAALPTASRGRHRIYYRNTHQAEIGAYLVNVLMPSDKQIEIDEQRRDYMQHELTVEYRVIPDSPWSSLWLVVAGLAMAGVLMVTRRNRVSGART